MGSLPRARPGGLGEEARALVKRREGPARVAPNDGGGEALEPIGHERACADALGGIPRLLRSGEPSDGGREAAAGAGCGIGATEEEFPLKVPSAASSIIMEESTAGIATSTSPGVTVGSETPPKGGWAWRTGMGPAILKGWPPAMGGGGMGATSGMPLFVTEQL